MENENILLIIIGMSLVTYIPRMLPFLFFDKIEFPPFIKSILKNLRFAVLGALIFPGILTINEDPLFGIIGGSTAFIISFAGFDIIYVVLGSIGVLVMYSFFF